MSQKSLQEQTSIIQIANSVITVWREIFRKYFWKYPKMSTCSENLFPKYFRLDNFVL